MRIIHCSRIAEFWLRLWKTLAMLLAIGNIRAGDVGLAFTNTDYPLDEFGQPSSSASDKRPAEQACYSCMSESFQQIWSVLLHHYYPPKNFTNECERPSAKVGVVPCRSACFTIVEEDHSGGVIVGNRYMRGCIDRLLLFGIDADLRHAIMRMNPGEDQMCRVIHRKLLSLVSTQSISPISDARLQGDDYDDYLSDRSVNYRGRQVVNERVAQNDLVILCTCAANRCNSMAVTTRSSTSISCAPCLLLPIFLPLLLFALTARIRISRRAF